MIIITIIICCCSWSSSGGTSSSINGLPVSSRLFQKYGMDVIGGVAFGMELNSLDDKDELFAKHATSMLDPSKLDLFLFGEC